MKTLDNLFSKKTEIVEKLIKNVAQLFYKKIFFEHLGPELKKIFDKKKIKYIIKIFMKLLNMNMVFLIKKLIY